MNLSIVKEEIVSDFRETVKGLVVFIRNGFVTHIATCHDQSLEGAIEKKMVRWRIGKHDTEGILIWSDSMGDTRIFLPS
jgi:hypothetical protein